MTRYNIIPYLSSTKYTQIPGKKNHYWPFKITPRFALSKISAAKWFLSNYPEVKLIDLRIIKTYKLTKVIYLCDKPAPWTET